ncbi:hypothetical protein OIU79_014326 [Salix purpurea]|uniref:Uncharacterized protein n=1 Tax=Salix purpurea TaxID=77065 RepID=A0A9Q0PQL1_SALPP|nr:hypothetical protein OIU79_014326 [Salix purpurea]
MMHPLTWSGKKHCAVWVKKEHSASESGTKLFNIEIFFGYTFGESLVLPSETSGVAAENDSGNEAQAEQNEELEVSKKHSSSM